MCLLRPPEPRTPDWAAETTDLAFLQNREVEVAAASVPLRPLSLAAVSSHGFLGAHASVVSLRGSKCPLLRRAPVRLDEGLPNGLVLT